MSGGIDLRWRPLATGETAQGLVYAALADGQRIEWQGPSGLAYRLLQWIGAEAPDTPFLYTVETGVDPADEAELMAWYEQDHLPRLAAVPGVVAAARYRLIEGEAPCYLAAYWLTAPEVFESPAWLEARKTDWTARMRPCFRHPRRTMRRLETSA
ncbi:hypothetical protein IAI18_10470 [Acetobacteraceae bacterium H6797]|nr:hypothetical protein [Acetobacteraceae bacterium H6797]